MRRVRRTRGAPARPRHPAARRSRARGRRARVADVDLTGTRRGELAEPVDERVKAVRCQLRLEPCPDLGVVRGGRRRRALARWPAGTTRFRRRGWQRRPAPRSRQEPYARGGRTRPPNGSSGSTRSRPWCGRGPFGGRHLRRPDIEATEDLARVCRDDLSGSPLPRDPLGEPDREPVLPVAVAPAITTSGGG